MSPSDVDFICLCRKRDALTVDTKAINSSLLSSWPEMKERGPRAKSRRRRREE